MITQITKLFGSPSGFRSMLWLEGKRLVDAGFLPGTTYTQVWLPDRIVCMIPGTLTIDVEGAKVLTRKVNTHAKKNPAIRIEGVKLQKLFGEKFTDVEVTYDAGVITIMGKTPVVVPFQAAA